MRKLVKANIRKDRAVFTVFLLILVLSTMLLHTGLLVNRYDEMYDKKKNSRGIGDAEMYACGEEDEIRSVMDGLSLVSGYYSDIILRPYKATVLSCEEKGWEDTRSDVVLHSADGTHAGTVRFMQRDDSLSGRRIYLNLYLASACDLELGDRITVDVESLSKETYTVAGIYEDIQQGNPYAWCSLCLDDASFRELWEKAASEKMSGSFMNRLNQVEVVASFGDEISGDDGLHYAMEAMEKAGIPVFGYTMDLAKSGYVSITNILAAFMTVFALIAIVVTFVMIVFTINNNIDRDVRNIGALRAVGFTNRQVRTGMLLEYLVIGFIGGLLGTILSYVVMPVIDQSLFRPVTGMFWEENLYLGSSLSVISGLMLAMTLVVLFSTRKLRDLHPATALRFGLKANSFKKNYLPLAKTRGRLNILLAAKSMLQSMSQNLIVLGVVIVVSIMTIFSGILFYNTRVDITRFQRLISGDVPDGILMLSVTDEEEWKASRDRVSEIPGITEAYGYSSHNINVEGRETFVFFTDSPEYLDCGVYEGQMFREENEAVIGRLMAEKLGVKIGDEVEVECAGQKARFIITGLQQAVVNMGNRLFISTEGAKRLGIQPEFSEIRIRVADASGKKVDRALEEARAALGEVCTGVNNEYRYQRSSENLTMFAALMLILMLILVNAAIIYLVIKLLLKTVFIRREKEFGIKKAVGFTSRQLRLQLALSLFPVCLLAAALGAVLGFFLVNPLISLVLSGFGIASADFIVKPVLILFTILIVAAVIFLMTYLMSGRMKRVSAYELIQE